ncbi:MAG: glycoside hydrolase family 28 protein [Chloroflexi bacterium]|nr:MAG: glycoside hydrolase family 28 protein [Chloroflexota bacterium]
MTRRLSRRQVLTTGAIVVGVAAASVASPLLFKEFQALTSTPHTAASGPLPWLKANRILANTVVPVFPNTSFVVTHSAYGAVGDGHTDNTAAFQKAIATCNAAGGGHVVVPAGTYVTGAIYLKSNVDLHLDPGATLMFSGDASRYPLVLTRYEGIECMNHSPMIYAFGEKNIALTGSGTLDASGTAPWNHGGNRAGVLEPLVARGVPPHRRNVAGKLRSSFVQPYNCDTVLIQGVTLRHSLFWQLHPTLCRHVTVDGVTTHHSGMNSDGCDPECCDHVVIKNSTLLAGDDNIAIKSGRDADGRRVNVPTQNVVIWNNQFEGPVGAICLGSEMTGGIQNVYAYNNSTIGSGTRYALFVKSNTKRGGFARNVHVDRFHGSDFHGAVVFVFMNYFGQTGNFLPDFSGPFNLSNFVVDTAPIALDVHGLPGDNTGTFNLSNCTFTHIANPANNISNVTKVNYTHVTINGKPVTNPH